MQERGPGWTGQSKDAPRQGGGPLFFSCFLTGRRPAHQVSPLFWTHQGLTKPHPPSGEPLLSPSPFRRHWGGPSPCHCARVPFQLPAERRACVALVAPLPSPERVKPVGRASHQAGSPMSRKLRGFGPSLPISLGRSPSSCLSNGGTTCFVLLAGPCRWPGAPC